MNTRTFASAPLRVGACALLVLVLIACDAPGQEATPPAAAPPAGNASTAFEETVKALQEQGLSLDMEQARRAVIDAVIKTADPQGALLGRDEVVRLQAQQAGQHYGPGLRISMTNGSPIVIDVESDGPAAAAGVGKSDLIVAVNETDLNRTDIVTALGLLRGQEPATLKLAIRRSDGTTNAVDVTRRLEQMPGVETAELLPAGIGYVKVNGLFQGVAAVIRASLDEWSGGEHAGLILDLRGADGRDVHGAADIASAFAEANMPLFSYRDKDDQDLEVFKASALAPLGMPTMVLIDEQTGGAAEVLAAALKRSTRGAMLLGQVTRGDPGIRDLVKLSPSETLYIATRRLVTADGTAYAGDTGVVPDVKVTPRGGDIAYEPEPPAEGKKDPLAEEIEDMHLSARVRGDAALRRAVDILLGLKALNIRGIQRSSDSAG